MRVHVLTVAMQASTNAACASCVHIVAPGNTTKTPTKIDTMSALAMVIARAHH